MREELSVKRIVIVGAGMVTQRFLEEIVNIGSVDWNITVVGSEPSPPYDRIRLGYEIAHGPQLADLLFSPPKHARFILGRRVESIDTEASSVCLDDGTRLDYTNLILATGAVPRTLPLTPPETRGVFTVRDFADAMAIHEWLNGRKECVIVGGGVLGIELAENFLARGVRVTLIERSPRLAAASLDRESSNIVANVLRKNGVQCILGQSLSRVEVKDGRVSGVVLEDGTEVAADTIVYAIGTRPNSDLARSAGLRIAEDGGVAINGFCRTSIYNIYAMGDCVSYQSRVFGILAPGYAMASLLAVNLRTSTPKSLNLPIDGLIFKTKLIPIATFGDKPHDDNYQTLTLSDPFKPLHKSLYLDAEGQTLLGGVLIGDTGDLLHLQQICVGNAPCPESPSELLYGDPTGFEASVLSDATVICSCRGVTKADIRRAVEEKGVATVAALKKETGAGTGCGGCLPTLTKLLRAFSPNPDAEHICEHFSFSRQELFHLIRTRNIETFGELIRHYGKGTGCEVCKPLVASILSSLWAQHVLDEQRATLQDTNDRSLANIQKDGSYSVVPRVPGGEITAAQLESITAVAKDFKLAIKITGAQRIALFGAKIDQLPAIWEQLNAAGLESGHAYGKSLRTVKSCVGTRWCRYGQQDSTALAIELELRYRGLRAPHKLKSAVSGCARECAEVRSKDFGAIATTQGWNLYICGNGGLNPQHALLFASDLTKEDLIRYLDRFLMFYVRTASRLERTAAWLKSLDGGVEYLRNVIVHDSLGIAADLEADMARVIRAYRDEWHEVVVDPTKRLLFSRYITVDETPPGLGDNLAALCRLAAVPQGGGVCVRWRERDLAIFRTEDNRVYATDNCEPGTKASVMDHGIVGDSNGEPKVTSPIYKHSYELKTGKSLDGDTSSLTVFAVMVESEWICIRTNGE